MKTMRSEQTNQNMIFVGHDALGSVYSAVMLPVAKAGPSHSKHMCCLQSGRCLLRRCALPLHETCLGRISSITIDCRSLQWPACHLQTFAAAAAIGNKHDASSYCSMLPKQCYASAHDGRSASVHVLKIVISTTCRLWPSRADRLQLHGKDLQPVVHTTPSQHASRQKTRQQCSLKTCFCRRDSTRLALLTQH